MVHLFESHPSTPWTMHPPGGNHGSAREHVLGMWCPPAMWTLVYKPNECYSYRSYRHHTPQWNWSYVNPNWTLSRGAHFVGMHVNYKPALGHDKCESLSIFHLYQSRSVKCILVATLLSTYSTTSLTFTLRFHQTWQSTESTGNSGFNRNISEIKSLFSSQPCLITGGWTIHVDCFWFRWLTLHGWLTCSHCLWHMLQSLWWTWLWHFFFLGWLNVVEPAVLQG